MMKFRPTVLLCFALLLAIASSAAQEYVLNQKDISTTSVKLYEIFDYLSDKLKKLDLTGNRMIEIYEIKTSIKEIMRKQERFEQLLLQLIDNKKKNEARETLVDEAISRCNSMCESNVNLWANRSEVQFFDKLGICIDSSTVKASCEPNPCLNGGQCKLTVTGSNYECKCPYAVTGRQCENFECSAENRCWRYADTLYVVFEENITWEQAFSKCEAKGMRMVMPKDQSSTEFLVQALKTVYQPSEMKHFWLGLKLEGSGYRWVDGTPLGNYLGGKPDFKSFRDSFRPILGLHGGSTYWWHIRLSEMSKYIHYPLCERRV